ncbi:hypothetical protein ACFQGT_09835 [Natrialbaceae archaeon GCM10025810]|uniref:hypothetical protein n=1 Tax=Halovalidus salilacus TaxID=3075124 RepID=UPI003607182C
MDESEFDLAGAYVAGIIDSGSAITVSVTKNKDSRLGYRITPEIRLRRKNPEVLSILDSWAMDQGVNGKIHQMGDSLEWRLSSRDGVRNFLEALQPYLIVHDNSAQILLTEVLPRLEDGVHNDKEGFLKIVEYADMIRDERSSPSAKYDVDYFEDLWEIELKES